MADHVVDVDLGSSNPDAGPVPILPARRLRLLVAALAVSLVGDEVAAIALVLFVAASGAGGMAVAAVLAAAILPGVLFGPLAGTLVDRWDTRSVLVVGLVVQALVMGGLAVAASEQAPIAVLLVGAYVVGAIETVVRAGVFALVPAYVGMHRLASANAWVDGASTAGFVVGAAVAGLAVAAVGVPAVLALDGVTFLLAAAALAVAGAARRTGGSEEHQPVWVEARAGVAVVRADPVAGRLLVIAAVGLIPVMAVNVATVFLVRDVYGASASVYGLVLAVEAMGLFAGALLAARVVAVPRWHVAAAMLGLGVMGAALAATAALPLLGVLFAGFALSGIANAVFNTATRTALHVRVPERFHGRAGALRGVAMDAATALGLLAGALTAARQPRLVFLVAGATAVAVAALGGWSLRRSGRPGLGLAALGPEGARASWSPPPADSLARTDRCCVDAVAHVAATPVGSNAAARQLTTL